MSAGAMAGKPAASQSKVGAGVSQVAHSSVCSNSLELEDCSQGEPPRTFLRPQKMLRGGCGHKSGTDHPWLGHPGEGV